MMRAFLYFAAAPAALLLAFQLGALVESLPRPLPQYGGGGGLCEQLFATGSSVKFQCSASPGSTLGYAQSSDAAIPNHPGVEQAIFVRPFTTGTDVWSVNVIDAGNRKVELKTANGQYLSVCPSTQNTVEQGTLQGHYAKLKPAVDPQFSTLWSYQIVTDSASSCVVALTNMNDNRQLTPCTNQCPKTTGNIQDWPIVAGCSNQQYTFNVVSATGGNNNANTAPVNTVTTAPVNTVTQGTQPANNAQPNAVTQGTTAQGTTAQGANAIGTLDLTELLGGL